MNGLQVERLSVAYPPAARRSHSVIDAVHDVSLEVGPGEIVGLLGPSGCGKSSLLGAIAGIVPCSGRVLCDGEDLTHTPPHLRGIGLVFQDGRLFPHHSVARNIGYGLEVTHIPSAERAARVSAMLELVGLAGAGSRDVTELSGGERQRVALARSLAPSPRVLLLDEPLSSLDRELRDRLAGELRRILLATHTTAVMVTHDPDEASTVCSRILTMEDGRLTGEAPSSRR